LVDECLSNTRQLLSQHKDKMKTLAEALIEKETLNFREIAKILEPHRSEMEIERDLLVMAEKRLVGKVPVVNLQALASLGDSDKKGKKNGKDASEEKDEALKKSDQSVNETEPTA
jgi:hypothetical protein